MYTLLLLALYLAFATASKGPSSSSNSNSNSGGSGSGNAVNKLALPKCAESNFFINYTSVPGFFLQDDPNTNSTTFDFTTVNFGLINRTYPTDAQFDPHHQKTQWERFGAFVQDLNAKADEVTEFKLLFMGRHADGLHNDAEAYFGTPAWNCFWSEQDGNATVTWADAHLSELGIQQTMAVHAFWLREIREQNIPLPQTYYTSPLYRCLQTSNLTFVGLPLPPNQPFIPTIKELFREGISGHTCDRRSNKTFIHDSFPTYLFEEGFSEFDLLWKFDNGETDTSEDARTTVVLDDVFEHDDSTYISITSHSGELSSVLRVLNHIPFPLNTGEVIPVLVQAEKIQGTPAVTTIQPWTTLSTCSVAPTTAPTIPVAAPTATATST